MPSHNNSDPRSLPLVEEEVRVDRETVETGAVRVRLEAARRTEVIEEPVVRHGFRVDRVQRHVVVQSRREPWHEDNVLVVPVYEEVLVRQLLLKEEIRLTPATEVHSEAQSVELLSQTPVIERRDEQGHWHEVPTAGTGDSQC
jgi:stress response protein YsnF